MIEKRKVNKRPNTPFVLSETKSIYYNSLPYKMLQCRRHLVAQEVTIFNSNIDDRK